ncbi:hypothetical protein RRG08_043460 [Elysia crispata]|uniref:Uncharacterized protein n=1 Tax=Elysia crispata TaxID=231223 RepID=A0AAE0XPL8_9GAST|nr:hypothetical protein RRG08_043460 [Elysia crispata]
MSKYLQHCLKLQPGNLQADPRQSQPVNPRANATTNWLGWCSTLHCQAVVTTQCSKCNDNYLKTDSRTAIPLQPTDTAALLRQPSATAVQEVRYSIPYETTTPMCKFNLEDQCKQAFKNCN